MKEGQEFKNSLPPPQRKWMKKYNCRIVLMPYPANQKTGVTNHLLTQFG